MQRDVLQDGGIDMGLNNNQTDVQDINHPMEQILFLQLKVIHYKEEVKFLLKTSFYFFNYNRNL